MNVLTEPEVSIVSLSTQAIHSSSFRRNPSATQYCVCFHTELLGRKRKRQYSHRRQDKATIERYLYDPTTLTIAK